MPIPLANMVEEALNLPAEERARLADHLLRSLNPAVDPDIEAAWVAEADRRRQAVLSGEQESLSSEAMIAEIRARRGR